MKTKKQDKIDPFIIAKLPAAIAKKYNVFPLTYENNTLFLGMTDPEDIEILDILKKLIKYNIVPRKLSNLEITNYIKFYYDSNVQDKNPSIEISINDDSIIKFVDSLISQAVSERASDIHIEPYNKKIRIRFRIDGILYDTNTPPPESLPAIISRIKIMANLNIAEKRLPQDGKIRVNISGRELDMRISVIPSVYGEGLVIRLLDKDSVMLGLKQLGFFPETLEDFINMITKSHGLILVSGPTGSGKTTTLYAALNKLNSSKTKIITIEDPVEYELYGIQQIQTKPFIGLTFSSGLRSVLRHDPDIILVGEIRDPETAKIAIQSALTGHLVFSTLHTNDSSGAVARLLDMGIENYLISSALIGVLAQRLVRIICPYCKESFIPDDSLLSRLKLNNKKKILFFKGRGCDKCKGSGYRGRTAIFELLKITDNICSLIARLVPSDIIKTKSIENGMIPLKEYGIKKALLGITTTEEVLRVCGD